MKLLKKIAFTGIVVLVQLNYLHAQLDTIKVKNVINAWNAAHNSKDLDILNELYAPTLLYYSNEHPKDFCIKDKETHLYPEFKLEIVTDILITTYEKGLIKCDFTKQVPKRDKKKKIIGTNTYPSYLLMKEENNQFLIVGESDLITDHKNSYVLNLGKQVEYANANGNNLIYILVAALVLVIIIIIVLIKAKSKRENPPVEGRIEIKKEIIVEEKIFENAKIEAIEQVIINPVSQETNLKNDKEEKLRQLNENAVRVKNLTKEYLTQGFKNTKTFLTKLFDTVDFIDRNLYGKRMKIFIIGCFLVLLVAPFFDWALNSDWITFVATFLFSVFVLVTILAFIGSWRDDNGNVTWARVWSRLQTYSETIKDTVTETKTTSTDENLYKFGRILFFAGIGWKALQNLSVFIRKPIEWFGITLDSLRKFEKITNQQWYWLLILSGVGLLFYLYKKNPKILERIKNELRELVGIKLSSKYSNEIVKIEKNTNLELVLNAKAEEQINSVTTISNSTLFKDFALAIQSWKPHSAHYEYEYQDRLYRHLRKHLPEAIIELEYPIGAKSEGNRGRADIVINETLLIEMKKDSSAGAIQRAKGQISQYSEVWANRGPVILLLCDYDYEHAKLVYGSTMDDLLKLGRPVLTIVAKPKVINIHV